MTQNWYPVMHHHFSCQLNEVKNTNCLSHTSRKRKTLRHFGKNQNILPLCIMQLLYGMILSCTESHIKRGENCC